MAKIAANDANFPKLFHPDNDGSNACAFLSVQIADKIHCLHQDQKGRNSGVWQCICDVAERVITESPRLINPLRKVEEFYDAQSAYKLIKNIGVPIDEYELSEEFVTGDYVFSWKGRENLMRALSSKPSDGNFSVNQVESVAQYPYATYRAADIKFTMPSRKPVSEVMMMSMIS